MSISESTETSEARELSLVGKVELRIALTDSDVKLESILKTYLAPLLLKLTSEHMSVRNKVISICQHINTRVKPPSIKLPVAALLKQFKDIHNALVRHFDLLYIQQGIDRLPIDERLDLLPTLLHGLASNGRESTMHAASLFNLLLRLLHHLTLPVRASAEDADMRSKLCFNKTPQDAEFVATWIGKLILLTSGRSGSRTCAGLSTEDYDFLHMYGKADPWIPSQPGGLNIIETKVAAARFLASGAFLDSERFLPALFASADPNSRISDIGDDILKRAAPTVSLEDGDFVARLFEVYLGRAGLQGSLPARVSLKLKILALLCKSKRATTFVPQVIQVVEEGLTPPEVQSQSSRLGSEAPAKHSLEGSKLRGQIFAFTNWLARVGSPADVEIAAPTLIHRLRLYLEGQGWPQSSDNASSAELELRNYSYEAIGLLARAGPKDLVAEPTLDLLRWLFNSLCGDNSGKDISISIEQALGSVLAAFTGELNTEIQVALRNLLLHYMTLEIGGFNASNIKVVRSTRFAAVRFTNRCLPYSDTTARWIDILAIGGGPMERNEVIEEGRKGIDPYWYRMMNPPPDGSVLLAEKYNGRRYQFPSFANTINELFAAKGGSGIEQQSRMELFQGRLAHAYNPAIFYCRNVLLHQALSSVQLSPTVNGQWERSIDAMATNDENARDSLRTHLRNLITTGSESRQPLTSYLYAAFNGMVQGIAGDNNKSGECLVEVASLSPDSAFDELVWETPKLQIPILATQHARRKTASHFFGLLASHKKCPAVYVRSLLDIFEGKIQKWNHAIGSEVLQVHGSILAKGFYLSRLSHRGGEHGLVTNIEQPFVRAVLDILSGARDKMLVEASIEVINQLSLFAVLVPKAIPHPYTSTSLIDKLTEVAEKGDEKAAVALGHFAMLCNEDDTPDSDLRHILGSLYRLHKVRGPEMQLAVGSALSCSAVGWNSRSLVSAMDVEGPTPKVSLRTRVLQDVLGKILDDCKTTKPALRQASVIWLLCLVQYCGHLPDFQSHLRKCQASFKGFLADRDTLNQESASRGLTVVYEKGDRELKDDLIRDLVGSFTGTGAGLAGNVSEETELFEPGALPTGEGSVTTYKDIMSLASEVGDTSLVYRFMSLASNNAIWSSRAAFGRFGLSTILSDSSVDGYLAQNPKLYPALFRYRFDPKPDVRSSMNDIWTALVKDSTATIDLHFDNIMQELLKSILGREWRVRQASCAAIADLVQGRPSEKYEKYLGQIWTLTFKVCDDIKDSVRTAAMSLARALTGVLTRSLEAGGSSTRNAESMLNKVLPFLLSPSGLESSAQEVQAFALSTLLQIIKSSKGKTLRPFVPNLVGRLLGLLSSLEPQAVNYIHLNADKYGVTAQQIDDVRLTSVRGSPMMEAIERCLDFLDDVTMKELERTLENAIKTAVGLPSKVGSSRVLVSLSTRHNFLFRAHADHFLRLLRKQVIDRNDTISSSYAAACGYLARLATDGELLKLTAFCEKLYFDSDDDRSRAIAGDVIYATSKHASDRFASLAGDILPFVFVGKHDAYERARELFQDTWNENVGGSRAVLLYFKEIVQLTSQQLESPRWAVKHTSALAVADIINSVGSEITLSSAKIIWPVLEKALGGKAWEGKETVLEALVGLAKTTTIAKSEGRIADQMQVIVIRESKRNNRTYRQYALKCLGNFARLRDSVDMFSQVYSIVEPIVQEALSDDGGMDVDSSSMEGASSKTIAEQTLAYSFAALLKSINPRMPDLVTSLNQTLGMVSKFMRSHEKSRTVQNAIYDGEKTLFGKLDALEQMPESVEDALIEYVKILFRQGDQAEQTRVKAADAAAAIADFSSKGMRLRMLLRDEITTARAQERSVSVQQSLERTRKIVSPGGD